MKQLIITTIGVGSVFVIAAAGSITAVAMITAATVLLIGIVASVSERR